MHKILTEKYIAVTPPLLTSTSPKAIIAFKKEYEAYCTARKKDTLPVLTMLECVEADTLEVLKVRQPGDVESEEKFKAFLEGKCAYESAMDAVTALGEVFVNMSINDIDERIDNFEKRFLSVKKRCEVSQLGFKDDEVVKAFIRGVRPVVLQDELFAMLKCNNCALKDIMEEAESIMRQQHKSYMAHKSLSEKRKNDNHQPRYNNNQQHHHNNNTGQSNGAVSVASSSGGAAIAGTTGYALRGGGYKGMCRGCG